MRRRGGWKAVLTTLGAFRNYQTRGFGKQDEKVYERNQRVKLRKRRAASNLVDMGRSAAHTCRDRAAGDSEAGMVGRWGGHEECLRRTRGEAAGV